MVGRTSYFVHMTFGLMVMPVFAPLSLTAQLHATWVGIGKSDFHVLKMRLQLFLLMHLFY